MNVQLTRHDGTVVRHVAVGSVTQHAGQAVELWSDSGQLLVAIDPRSIAYVEITP